MNQYTFDLIAQHRPEVLERVLRVIRLRGFTVTNMDMALVETKVQLKNHCKNLAALLICWLINWRNCRMF